MKNKHLTLIIAIMVFAVLLFASFIVFAVAEMISISNGQILWTDENDVTIEFNPVSESDNSYFFIGVIKWKEQPSTDKKYIKDKSFDLIDINWGGDGALALDDKQTDAQIYGEYLNGEEISFSRKKSDSYGGIVWQFTEISDSGIPINFVEIQIRICRLYDFQGKEANVKMSFAHTYEELQVSSDRNDIYSGKIKVICSSVEKYWRKDAPILNIKY